MGTGGVTEEGFILSKQSHPPASSSRGSGNLETTSTQREIMLPRYTGDVADNLPAQVNDLNPC